MNSPATTPDYLQTLRNAVDTHIHELTASNRYKHPLTWTYASTTGACGVAWHEKDRGDSRVVAARSGPPAPNDGYPERDTVVVTIIDALGNVTVDVINVLADGRVRVQGVAHSLLAKHVTGRAKQDAGPAADDEIPCWPAGAPARPEAN